MNSSLKYILAIVFAWAVAGCSSEGRGPGGDEAQLSQDPIRVSPTTQINTINYTLTGPNNFSAIGSFSVRAQIEPEVTITNVPTGGPYGLRLHAASTDGYLTCVGGAGNLSVTYPGNRPQDEQSIRMICVRSRFFVDAGDPYWLDAQPTLYLNVGVNLDGLSDAGPPDSCVPTTCAAKNVSCGDIPDNCGGRLECGTCAAPQTCGGGGQPGVCGQGAPNDCDTSTTACLHAQDKQTSPPGLLCSACMAASGCLDPTKQGGSCETVSGNASNACEAVLGASSTVTEKQVCLHTLKDVFSSGCSWSEREIPCLCGATDTQDCFSAHAQAPNGPTSADYICDFGTSSPPALQTDLLVTSRGAGQATSILECAAKFGCDCFPTPPWRQGTWSTVATPSPTTPPQLQLLTDGTVLVGGADTTWSRLKPDDHGNYANGTWLDTGSSNVSRSIFPSATLKDGRYWVGGGEFVNGQVALSPTMEIYDPVANTWTQGPDMPDLIGDTGVSILPDGKVLVGSCQTSNSYVFDPAANPPAWSFAGQMSGNADEQSWVLMQNGAVMYDWDTFTGNGIPTPYAQTYTEASGWADSLPSPVSLTQGGSEIGPGLVLYSGKVLFLGNSMDAAHPAHTAYYDPSTPTWTVGPDAPSGESFGDSAGCVLSTGNVLCAAGLATAPTFSLWELDPNANRFFPVDFPAGVTRVYIMLQLPNGQVLAETGPSLRQLYIYTPSGIQETVGVPSITSVTPPTAGVYTLNGTNLNGLTTGSGYGDDMNNATMYPIVYLTNSSGNVYYARTFNFSTMAPTPGPGSCQFTLPADAPTGTYQLHLSASGVEATNTVPINVP
jgi:hypothetical protein